MPVREVKTAPHVEADVVDVNPPNAELSLNGHRLCPAAPSQPRGQRLPIDVPLSSLARELGERTTGLELSGMAADGTLGLEQGLAQGPLMDGFLSPAEAAALRALIAALQPDQPPQELPLQLLARNAAVHPGRLRLSRCDRKPQMLACFLRIGLAAKAMPARVSPCRAPPAGERRPTRRQPRPPSPEY